MKKKYLAITMMALALGMTACSSKPAETTAAAEATSQAAEMAAADAEDGAADPEEEADGYFYGIVREVSGDTVTIADEEGTEAVFDISEADVEGESDTVGVGDEVEVTFAGELSADAAKAVSLEILTSAAGESEEAEEAEEGTEDSVISGTIEASDDKTLTLQTEDGSITFNARIAQKVTGDGLKAGAAAEVTYYGDLDDPDAPPVATRIVTEDVKDTDAAAVKTLTGTVAEAGSDYVVLDTADPDNTWFTFMGAEGMFEEVSAGDTITVIYEGSLTDKTIQAVGME